MNLLESGWEGYDREIVNVPSESQGDWMVRQAQSYDDEFWTLLLKWPENDDQLDLQRSEDDETLQKIYPTPYFDPYDDPLLDPEDDPLDSDLSSFE